MKAILQQLKSKTVLFSLLIMVFSVLQGYVFLLPITPLQQMFVGLVIGLVVFVLRQVTNKPVAEK